MADKFNAEKECDDAVKVLIKGIMRAVRAGNESVNCDRSFLSVIKKVNTTNKRGISKTTYTIQDEFGADRDVRCVIPNLSLSVGQNVWVKLPCGNLNRMHIYGVN